MEDKQERRTIKEIFKESQNYQAARTYAARACTYSSEYYRAKNQWQNTQWDTEYYLFQLVDLLSEISDCLEASGYLASYDATVKGGGFEKNALRSARISIQCYVKLKTLIQEMGIDE